MPPAITTMHLPGVPANLQPGSVLQTAKNAEHTSAENNDEFQTIMGGGRVVREGFRGGALPAGALKDPALALEGFSPNGQGLSLSSIIACVAVFLLAYYAARQKRVVKPQITSPTVMVGVVAGLFGVIWQTSL